MKKALTFCILLFAFCIFLSACGDKCEHSYDNDCDITCNECGEERTVTHDFADADCDTPKTCKICGATDHHDADHDYTCDNAGCQGTVGNPSKDESDGIDLPIDKN